MSIPIQNIYYLLSYAWNLLDEANELEVQSEDLPHVVDLLARLLVCGTRSVIRRGIDCSYLPQSEVCHTLRGRVDLGTSARRLLLRQGKAQCYFEEHLPDLLQNQILKSSLAGLAEVADLSSHQRAEVWSLLHRLEGISYIRIQKSDFSRVHLHRNNTHYRLLMGVCELIYDNLLVAEKSGKHIFRDFIRDEKQMAKLFEAFVTNFFRRETNWEVSPQQRISWQVDFSTNPDLLPEMRADVILRGKDKTVVVETKFYAEALQAGPWGGTNKFRAPHLYQLHAYLSNLEGSSIPQDQRAQGILLYPTVGESIHETVWLKDHLVAIHTVNLQDNWPSIHQELKKIPNLIQVDI